MNDCISVVTIGKLMEAHFDKDEEKFLSYAKLIENKYEKEGNDRAARIIKSKLSGDYKKQSKINVVLDNIKKGNLSISKAYNQSLKYCKCKDCRKLFVRLLSGKGPYKI